MTAFNINQFRASLGNGGARPNQYMVALSFPPYVVGASHATQMAPFGIHNAALPSIDHASATVMYRGREFHMAGDIQFQPATIAFYNDTGFTLRTAFESWIHDGQENLQWKVGYTRPTMYMRDIDIYQLDRNGQVLKGYKLHDAFPINVSEVALGFEMNNQVSSTTVTFRYQTFTYTGGGGSNDNHTGIYVGGSIGGGGFNVSGGAQF